MNEKLFENKNVVFFDTELLVLAKYNNLKAIDTFISWEEQKESIVKLFKCSLLFFRYLFYFRKQLKKNKR